MADLTNTTVLARMRVMFDKRLLDRLLPNLVYATGLESRPLSMRSGNQIKFRRIESLAAATTPLTEGVTPTGSVLSQSTLTSTIYQLGDFVTITDIVEATDESPLIAEAMDVCTEQAENSVDRSIRDVVTAGTYYLRCNTTSNYTSSGGRTTVNAYINKESLRAAVRQLEGYNVKKFKSMIKASTGVGSSPIPEAYIMLAHPHNVYDLRHNVGASNGFIPVHQYSSQVDLMPNEVGAFDDGIRIASTTNCKIWENAGSDGVSAYKSTLGANVDVYGCLVYGRGFAARTELEGGIQTKFKPRGSAGTGDPLDQRSTVGWIIDFVPTILQDYAGVRIECAASI